MKKHWIGAHPSDNGGMDMAVRRAAKAKQDTLQLFTAIPKFYGDKSGISESRLERFRKAIADTKMDPARFITHGAYVLNCATPDTEKWTKARDGLKKELERSTMLGIGTVCFHPGAATDGDRTAAAERIAAAMTFALQSVDSPVRLLVENTAGAGTTMGRTAEEVASMLSRIPKKLRPRTGYGLDTCHLYASGYDIAKSKAELTKTLDAFEEATGEAPGFFHLNDSEGALGSNRDRHMLIGEGAIGKDAFGWLMADPRSRGVPLVLETPQENAEIAPDDDTPDPYDVRMLGILRRFTD
ncbi:MAG TPA: deoxyribonuclease IV [Gemmatimonadaceae bacterium]